MWKLQISLVIFTLLIYALTISGINAQGWFWPAVFFGDLLQLNWRAQFNGDFLMHLLLLATWTWWREGGGVRGSVIGFLCVFMGGMFSFPYLLYLIIRNKGSFTSVFMGVHRQAQAVPNSN